MSGYSRGQVPMRMVYGAAAVGSALLTYGLYKVGANLDILSAGGVSNNPFVLLPPAATATLTLGTTFGALTPWEQVSAPEVPDFD